jgi:hypothetical protein
MEKDFYLPTNSKEHKTMVEKMEKAGTLQNEAEQIIVNGRTSFNKAIREHIKLWRQWLIAQLVERSLSVMKDPGLNLGMEICSSRY